MPTVTEHGVTYFKSELPAPTTVVTPRGEDTTVDITIEGVTLNFTKDTQGDPDVVFNTETSIFQSVSDDYLEGNPGLVNNRISSYVGQFYSDTVLNEFTIFDTIEDGVGTRFSSSELSFDSSSMRFDRRTT